MAYKSANLTNGDLEYIDQTVFFNDLYINSNERSFKVPRIKILLQDYNYEGFK